ncbi:hypothetical protein Nepgr_010180 [Nepenthes gracilis]|uniref:Uncharacterized protein n=1 Tax=Nepenthes gracilis TaxID=150966 RepID=A0AAD3XL30_NEPGR|nr:hypothetical protein Nepgr_010180 [Nepenthes gracilis]
MSIGAPKPEVQTPEDDDSELDDEPEGGYPIPCRLLGNSMKTTLETAPTITGNTDTKVFSVDMSDGKKHLTVLASSIASTANTSTESPMAGLRNSKTMTVPVGRSFKRLLRAESAEDFVEEPLISAVIKLRLRSYPTFDEEGRRRDEI